MTDKIRKLLSLFLALTVIMFVFVPSFAEEPEDFDDDEEEAFVSFDDDETGSAEEETALRNAPEMNEELIFADDWSEALESKSEAEIERQAEVKRLAEEKAGQQAEEDPQAQEEAVTEETAEAESEQEAAEQAEEENKEEEAATSDPEDPEEAAEETAETETGDPDGEAAGEETGETAEENEEEETGEAAEEETDQIIVTVEAVMVSENEMKLIATVHGAEEETEFTFQWQVSVDEGENFSDIEDATENEILILLTEEDFGNLWRVRVHTV